MNDQERQVIEELFARLAEIERQGGPRDPDAEAFIRRRLSIQPAAPYYMAQTVVAQGEALRAAQDRIAQLERRPASGPEGAGSFLSGLFGGGGRRGPWGPAPQPQPQPQAPMPYAPGGYGQGRGFLAGAAQTAMGVAGGVLLGNLIADAFAGHPWTAPEGVHPSAADDRQAADYETNDDQQPAVENADYSDDADYAADDVGDSGDFGQDI